MNRREFLELEDQLFAQIASVLPCSAHAIYFPKEKKTSKIPVWIPEENRLLLPLRQNGSLLGVLMCRDFTNPDEVTNLLPYLPSIAQLCLANLQLYCDGRKDRNTGLSTRSVLIEAITHETEAIRNAFSHGENIARGSSESGFSLVVVRFLGISELRRRYGYTFSENLFSALGKAWREAIPEQHLAARIGEHEFAALLLGNNQDTICKIIVSALHKLQETTIPDPYTGHSVSIIPYAGYSVYPQDIDGSRFHDAMEPNAALIHKAGLAAEIAKDMTASGRIMAFGRLLMEGGRIRRTLPLSSVEISLGRGENVREGQRFSVWAQPSDANENPAYKGEIVITSVYDMFSVGEILNLGDNRIPLRIGDTLTLIPDNRVPQLTEATHDTNDDLLRHGDFLATIARAREGSKQFAIVLMRIPNAPASPSNISDESTSNIVLRLCRSHFQKAEIQTISGRFSSNTLMFFHRDTEAQQLSELYTALCKEISLLGILAVQGTEPALYGAGIAVWPFLQYHPSDMIECARKALEYALLLPAPHVGLFDSLAINISADQKHCRGDIFGALEEYKMAVLADSNNALAWNSIGVCMESLGHIDEARRHFEHAVQCSPDDSSFVYNLGTIYQKLNDISLARQTLKRCLALNPKHLFAALRLGQIAESKDDIKNARHWYQKAAEADSNSALPSRYLARLALKGKRPDEAREFLHHALLRDPRDAEALSMMARLYLDGGEDAELAEHLAKQSVALRPDRKSGWLVLADALLERGFARESRAALLKAEEL